MYFLGSPLRGSRSTDTPVISRIPNHSPKTILLGKNSWILALRKGKHKISLEQLVMPESKEVLKKRSGPNPKNLGSKLIDIS